MKKIEDIILDAHLLRDRANTNKTSFIKIGDMVLADIGRGVNKTCRVTKVVEIGFNVSYEVSPFIRTTKDIQHFIVRNVIKL